MHYIGILIIIFKLTICQIINNQIIDDDQESLLINIKNDGGQVYQENITAHPSQDTIQLQFKYTDGSHYTQFIDFKSEVQIFRLIRLGEQDLGEKIFQVYCFVVHLPNNEFIASDAMSKLRQRNPGAIRQAEENKEKEIYEMDLSVELHKSSIISPHLPKLCNDAVNSTFAREIDLRAWASSKVLNRDIISLTSSVHKSPHIFSATQSVLCSTTLSHDSHYVENTLSNSCLCHSQMCIGWYPCSLKYCKGRDSTTGKMINYRCGIKTCSKCRDFNFFVKQKSFCLLE